jgi:hypothetical protein
MSLDVRQTRRKAAYTLLIVLSPVRIFPKREGVAVLFKSHAITTGCCVFRCTAPSGVDSLASLHSTPTASAAAAAAVTLGINNAGVATPHARETTGHHATRPPSIVAFNERRTFCQRVNRTQGLVRIDGKMRNHLETNLEHP